MRTDFCARVNVDPSPAVRPLGHDSWNQRQVHCVKNVRHSLNRNRLERRVGKNDFFVASRRRIAFKRCVDVGPKEATNIWKLGEEIGQKFVGLCFGRFVRRNFSQAPANFGFQSRPQVPHAHARDLGQIFRAHDLFAAEAGKHQAHQIGAGGFDGKARGKRGGSIEVIDAASLAVSLQQLIDRAVLTFFHYVEYAPRRVSKQL